MMNFSDFYFKEWAALKEAMVKAAPKTEQDILAAYHVYHAMHKSDAVRDFPADSGWVQDVLTESAKPHDEWDALFEQAAALGPDCAERVRRRREQSDHPPSSICCGAAAKHRKRMIQEARDIIRSFQDGTAITDKTLNDTKGETD